jgi:hypothetical protein
LFPQLLEKIEKYTKAAWWKESNLELASPLLRIQKKSRLLTVVDARERNANTVKDLTPFPNQDTIRTPLAAGIDHAIGINPDKWLSQWLDCSTRRGGGLEFSRLPSLQVSLILYSNTFNTKNTNMHKCPNMGSHCSEAIAFYSTEPNKSLKIPWWLTLPYVCPNFGMLVTVDPRPQNAKQKNSFDSTSFNILFLL